MLIDFLKKEHIQLSVSVDNWEEAIYVSGRTLLASKVIDESYIDAMINSVKKMGPYIVIIPGVAIAHARPEDGVNEVGLALTTLNPPVKFGSEHNDPVSLIITLASTDHDAHITALGELVELIDTKEKYNRIVAARDVELLLKMITNK